MRSQFCPPTLSRQYVLPSPTSRPGRRAYGPLLYTAPCHAGTSAATRQSLPARSADNVGLSSLKIYTSSIRRTDHGSSARRSALARTSATMFSLVGIPLGLKGRMVDFSVHSMKPSCIMLCLLWSVPLGRCREGVEIFIGCLCLFSDIQDARVPHSVTPCDSPTSVQVSSTLRSGCLFRIHT